MKWQIVILMALIAAGIAYAQEASAPKYKPREIFGLSLHLTNSTGDVTGANCSIQIRNSTMNVTLNDVMKEANGGFYNYTYNTSQVGKYSCRQNCTMGANYAAGTCDFVIEGDSQMPVAIIFVMAIVIIFLFVLSRYTNVEAIKYLLIAVAAMSLILTVNIGMLLAKESLPESVQSLLSTTYLIVLYTLEFILGLGVLFLMLYYVTKWLPKTVKVKRQ